MDRNKKDDDEAFIPFQGLEKGIVLQEKNIFNQTPLNPKKCCQLLTKILYLLTQGEKFTQTEATDLFFAVTKLFQSKDIPLRRMVYLVLKELMDQSEHVIIVVQSLTKDMNSRVDLYRANSIRVLCRITDGAMLQQVERYLKQAIVDKEPYVSSAALVSGIHLISTNGDIVKRWVSEVQEALQNRSVMAQYHALGLLHQIKRHDRLAVSKLVQTMTKSNLRSPYAHCLLIRFAAQLMEDDPTSSAEFGFFTYLESCLRNKSDMVIYEAARAICNLRDVTARELTPAITVLQLFLSSPKSSLRFAAIRTLNKVAQTHPMSVSNCNLDMEHLITDSNRSIATLAITTLLKTGNESNVDRLMKQITSFIGDISDEFKIVVVEAIKTLCIKFPSKQRGMLSFLSTILREEGGFEYKKTIVDTILTILEERPESKEAGFSQLCEFIEDCEHPFLSTKILHLLGKEGPFTSYPSRYIRYIYNRICLEKASVRAAAVSSLAKFGVHLPDLRPSIITLLKRCLFDNDDEVRDRAVVYLNMLEKEEGKETQKFFIEEFKIPIINLEKSLLEYRKHGSSEPFDLNSVSLIPPVQEHTKVETETEMPKQVPESEDVYAAMLASIPEFANLGPIFKSSKPVQLTESETEYVVTCVKHVFEENIVLQFHCTNTLNEQVLENISVKTEFQIDGLKSEFLIPLASLPYGQPGSTYVCLQKKKGFFPIGTIQTTLKFITKEIDITTGEPDEQGFEDEYQLEDLELSYRDYVQKTFVNNFAERWEVLECESVQTYALGSMKNLPAGVKAILQHLEMQPVDRTERVPPKRTKHILHMAGTFIGDIPLLGRCRMKFVEGQGVQLELTIRSTDENISAALAESIQLVHHIILCLPK